MKQFKKYITESTNMKQWFRFVDISENTLMSDIADLVNELGLFDVLYSNDGNYSISKTQICDTSKFLKSGRNSKVMTANNIQYKDFKNTKIRLKDLHDDKINMQGKSNDNFHPNALLSYDTSFSKKDLRDEMELDENQLISIIINNEYTRVYDSSFGSNRNGGFLLQKLFNGTLLKKVLKNTYVEYTEEIDDFAIHLDGYYAIVF